MGIHWDLLITEAVLAAVLPAEYRRYARPICGALVLFLESLPGGDQQVILAQQAALPAAARPAHRLGLLARACPTLHKLGQTLARDHRLADEFRQRLRPLESLPPSIPFPVLQELLARELGPLARRGLTLVPPALAEGSAAVVVPFRANRYHGRSVRGVFKVLKPGIEARLERELALFSRIGAYLDEQCAAAHLPPLEFQEALEQVRDKLCQEIRLDREQLHLRQAAALYRHDPAVHIPALLEPCTPRVTAMEHILGRKIAASSRHRPDPRAADLAVTALLAKPLFAADPRMFFHADPHAGNLFLTPEGRLAILDWSLVGRLTAPDRVAIAQILLGALLLQPQRIGPAIATLAARGQLDPGALQVAVDTALTRLRRGAFPGRRWLLGLLDDAVQTAGLRVRPDLLLFRRALHTLEGVLADLGAAGPGADWPLARSFLGHLAGEWPRRWCLPPTSRDCPTRLSNADLLDLAVGWPWSALQIWTSLFPFYHCAAAQPAR